MIIIMDMVGLGGTVVLGLEDAMFTHIVIIIISTMDHPQHMDVIIVIQIVYALLVALPAT
jgi:hypothetical protein